MTHAKTETFELIRLVVPSPKTLFRFTEMYNAIFLYIEKQDNIIIWRVI